MLCWDTGKSRGMPKEEIAVKGEMVQGLFGGKIPDE